MKKNEKYAILLIAVLAIGYMAYSGMLTQYVPALSTLGQTPNQNPASNPALQDVTKPVKFYLLDKFGGSAMTSYSLAVYDSELQQIETLTTASDGTIATSADFVSGTILHVKAYKSAQTEMEWFTVNVPQMTSADANSLTTNKVTLKFFDWTAPTMSVKDQTGTVIADAGNYNYTANGKTAVMQVSWSQGTDGDGYIASSDPLNNVQWDAILVAKASGTNYETINVNGMGSATTLGSAKYWMTTIDPNTLTKQKIGNTYTLKGMGGETITVDLSGYSGSAGDLDFYIYIFADGNYFRTQANFGPDSTSVVSGAPYTINLIA